MNLLNSKISFDLASSTRMFTEIREHLRRLLRIFFHLAYEHSNGASHDSAGPDSDSESQSPNTEASTTPRSPGA